MAENREDLNSIVRQEMSKMEQNLAAGQPGQPRVSDNPDLRKRPDNKQTEIELIKKLGGGR